ncbi:MAG: LptF/LptG family permease, partial [Thermodesulfovibrionales bacterium]
MGIQKGSVTVMTIIQRHYLKEFFTLFIIIALGLAVISSLIDLIDKLDDFVKYSPSPALVLLYAALDIPRYLVYLMPVAALLSSMFVFGQAGKRKETVAIKASGGSMKALLTPFIYSGALLCIAGFLTS